MRHYRTSRYARYAAAICCHYLMLIHYYFDGYQYAVLSDSCRWRFALQFAMPPTCRATLFDAFLPCRYALLLIRLRRCHSLIMPITLIIFTPCLHAAHMRQLATSLFLLLRLMIIVAAVRRLPHVSVCYTPVRHHCAITFTLLAAAA